MIRDAPVLVEGHSWETNAWFISEQPLVNVILVNVVVVLVPPSKHKHIDERVTEGLDDRQEVGGGREEELT